MDYLFTILASILEWIPLLSFTIILLGYHFKRYVMPIIVLSTMISFISFLLRLTSLHVVLIIFIQMILLFFLIRWLFRVNSLESLVISSIGYGFYMFIQLLVVEIIITLSTNSYFDVFFSISFIVQIITTTIVTFTCFILYKKKYHLAEFRHHLRTEDLNKKIKTIIITNSLLTFVFICLAVFAILADEVTFKYSIVLFCIMVLFAILAIHLILHTQFQMKHLIEAQKFYLDQEQQVATIVEKLNKNYASHYKAILKLSERNSHQLIKEYIEEHKLHKSPSSWLIHENVRTELSQVDELTYAFLVNKRKLARLFDVKLTVSSEINFDVSVTLRQIRYLSMIIDDLIFTQYLTSGNNNKWIHFHLQTSEDEMRFEISSNLEFNDQLNSSLNLFDALLKYKQDNAVVQSDLKPFTCTISCKIT